MVAKDVLWAKVNEDKELQELPEAVRKALRPYVEAAPIVLADILDRPATFSNVAQAKAMFLRYCVDNRLVEVMVAARPEDESDLLDREALSEMLDMALNQLVELMTVVTGNAAGFLETIGMTEDEVMLSPEIGLNAEARTLYEAGQLTIEKLLLVQPNVILKGYQ